MGSKSMNNSQFGDGASPGKIFIGGLAKDTTNATFNQHFGKYGEITDSVIMKDRISGQPRGFGFITYADSSVVDKVIEDTHILNGKQVEIKRTIPKGAGGSKELKTKKIFVGGLPSTVTEDDFKKFFSKYGKVEEHQIICDRETNRSRGFGFIVFESEEVVDQVLANGNRIDLAGTQVEIKKAEPKKASNPPPALSYGRNPRARPLNDGFSGPSRARSFSDGFGPSGPFDGGLGTAYFDGRLAPKITAGMGSRFGEYGPYNPHGSEFGNYDSFGDNSLGGGYRDEPYLGFPSRYGAYRGGYNGSGGVGGYNGSGSGYGNYGGPGFDSYDVGPGSGPPSYGGAGGFYDGGGRGGGYNNRYHPYAK